MKKLVILLIAVASLFPSLAWADAGGADSGLITCEDATCKCTYEAVPGYAFGPYDLPVGFGVPSDSSDCETLCIAYSYNTQGGDDNPAHTQATYSCPTETGTSVPVKEPLYPKLNVPIPGFLKYDNATGKWLERKDGTWVPVEYEVINGIQQSNLLGTYVNALYSYLLGAGTLVAVVMLMIAGIQYATARGDTHVVDQAKKRIGNAVAGVILLLLAYNIAFIINPATTTFQSLAVPAIKEIPLDSLFSLLGSDSVTCTGSGQALYGQSTYQDCLLNTYGSSQGAVKLTTIKHGSRNYQVNVQAADDFKAVFDAIDELALTYDIGRDTAGGTFSWRCNKNAPNVLSAHAFGIAIDINPDMNPNCPKGCLDSNSDTACACVTAASCEAQCTKGGGDIPVAIIDIFKKHGFTWLGQGTGLKDFMHFTYVKQCRGGG